MLITIGACTASAGNDVEGKENLLFRIVQEKRGFG